MLNFTEEQDQYIESKEAFLDQFIDQDDEYKLFISSYIHGHFSVVAAKLSIALAQNPISSQDISHFAQHFQSLLCGDIENAIADQELSQQDLLAVRQMLKSMFT